MRYIIHKILNDFWKMVILSVFSTAAILKSAFGLEPEGIAKDYGIDLQNPVTDVAQDVYSMHLFVTIIMALITLLVLGLLVWVCYKYSENKNKKPSKTVHNTLIEILWTAIPVLILVVY